MPSMLHEALRALFDNRPALAPELLRDAFGVPVPAYRKLRIVSGDLTTPKPAEQRADLVVLLRDRGKPRLVIVVEVQLDRKLAKRLSWPAYVAGARARYHCPCYLLVVAPDRAVARWCRTPIELGHPGLVVRPLVLGPNAVAEITSVARARACPELAVLSVMAHRSGPNAAKIARAAVGAVVRLDDERAASYHDIVMASLGEAARIGLESLMLNGRYEYQSDFAKRYFAKGLAQGEAQGEAKGKAEGKAEGVVAVLRARGIALSRRVEKRIRTTTDIAVLDRWIVKAVTAGSAGELFE